MFLLNTGGLQAMIPYVITAYLAVIDFPNPQTFVPQHVWGMSTFR